MIEIRNLSAGYGGELVLKDVSLSARSGEMVALIGPNGAGKSTLIRAVCGEMKPASGAVFLNGRDVSRLNAEQRARLLAVVPQARLLPAAFPVYQTVLLGRTPYLGWLGQAGARDHEAAREAMRQTEIAHLAERRMGELSGGEQQRVLLARALAQATPILVMDEPTNHLDVRRQTEFLNLARRLARENGLTILAALHDLNLTSLYADRVAVLADGELKAVGSPEETFTEEVLFDVYGARLRVIPHPEYGIPLALPEGPAAEYAPCGRGYAIETKRIKNYVRD